MITRLYIFYVHMKLLWLVLCFISVFSLPIGTRTYPHYLGYKSSAEVISSVAVISSSEVDVFNAKKGYSKLYFFGNNHNPVEIHQTKISNDLCLSLVHIEQVRQYKRYPEKFKCLSLPSELNSTTEYVLIARSTSQEASEYSLEFSSPLVRARAMHRHMHNTHRQPSHHKKSARKLIMDGLLFVPRLFGNTLAHFTLLVFELLNISPVRDSFSTTIALVTVYVAIVLSLLILFIFLAVPDPNEFRSIRRAYGLLLLFPFGAHCLYLEKYLAFMRYISVSILALAAYQRSWSTRSSILLLSGLLYAGMVVYDGRYIANWTCEVNRSIKADIGTDQINEYNDIYI